MTRNVKLFTILAVGAIYFLYEDLRKLFIPTLNTNLEPDEPIARHIRRNLLALDPNVNAELLELKSDLNTLNKGKLSTEEINSTSFIAHKKFDRNRMKKLIRSKRDTRQNDFKWKFSLNVTNNEDAQKGVPNIATGDGLRSKTGKDEFLNLAVQMEGASPDDSLKELHQAWDSLGLLLKKLYGKNSSLKENVRYTTVEINTKPNDIVSSDLPTEKPELERAPKILFGLLNFGNNKNASLNGTETTLGNGDSSESATLSMKNIALGESRISTEVNLARNANEEPKAAFGLQESTSLEPTVASITESFKGFESASSDLNTQFSVNFEKTTASQDNFPIKITTIKPEPSFTSEQLKDFCNILLSTIQDSPRLADLFSEGEDSDKLDLKSVADKEMVAGFQSLTTDVPKEVTTKPTNQRFRIWASFWNRILGRRQIQHPVDVSLQSSDLTPKQAPTFEKTKNNSNDELSFKDQSSTVLENSDPSESDIVSDENKSALNNLDCENFFRQMLNDGDFSNPNLLDMINNPFDSSQFNFTEMGDDKQIESTRSGSHSTDSIFKSDFTEDIINSFNASLSSDKSTDEELAEFSVDELSGQSSKNLFEITVPNQHLLSTPNSNDAQENFRSEAFDNLITEKENDLRKSATEIGFLSDKFTTMQIRSSTEILDGSLFISPNAHAKNDKSSEIPSLEDSSDINGKIFGLLGFGSGERSLEDSNSLNTQNPNKFPENRSFHPDLINLATGDSELNNEFSVNEQEITSSDSVTVPNTFEVILNKRQEENIMNSTEVDAFDINDGKQPIEDERTISSVEKSLLQSQFKPAEKTTERQNVLDLINMTVTQSISDNLTPFENVFNENHRVELQFESNEKVIETQTLALHSTNIPDTKLLSENQEVSPTEARNVPADPRFMDTLFLTGGGAGDFFGNNNGQINFLQEPDTTSFPIPAFPRQSRRGGRVNDASFVTWPAEQEEHASQNQFEFVQSQIESVDPELNSHDMSIDKATETVEDGLNDPKNNGDMAQAFQGISSATPIRTSATSLVIPKKKAKDLLPRYCNHAGECNVFLNEGCITKEGHGICDCRRSFVRHPETDICEAPFMLKPSLKLPGEVFHEDLRNKHSELYQNKTRDAIDTMWLVVYQDPILAHNIAGIDVAGFEKGSLVVHWELTFVASKNENVSEIIQEVDEKLKENFKRKSVLQSAPLNVENSRLLSPPIDIDPCANEDMNYCSKNADCLRDEYRGFRCRCKVGYVDNSKNPLYPGETCIAICPPDYCGNGYCEVKPNGEKQCICKDSYFDERCYISKFLAISCIAIAVGALSFVLLVIALFCKRLSQRRYNGSNQMTSQSNPELGPVSPRLMASAAVEGLGPAKILKYSVLCTPLKKKPYIQITSPSVSSISYDSDSTFNRTRSPVVNMEPQIYDSVPVDIGPPKYDSVPVHMGSPIYDSVPVDMEPPICDSVPVDMRPPKNDSVPVAVERPTHNSATEV